MMDKQQEVKDAMVELDLTKSEAEAYIEWLHLYDKDTSIPVKP